MKVLFAVMLLASALISYDLAAASAQVPVTPGPSASAQAPAPPPSPAAAASSAQTPQNQQTPVPSETPLLGPVPGLYMVDFALVTIDGTPLPLHQITGKALVINFFATWCPPCRDETPAFVRVANDLRSSGIAFVAVDEDEKQSIVRRYADAVHMNAYPILMDDGDKISDRFGINALPTTIVVGPDGIVRFAGAGAMSETGLRNAIAAATGQSLTRSQLDAIDHDTIPAQTVYTFDLSRTEQSGVARGVFKVDVYSRSSDCLAVRAVETWADDPSEFRYFGVIYADGALDFGAQPLNVEATALFSLLARHLRNGHAIEQASQWTQTRRTAHVVLSERYRMSAGEGGLLGFQLAGSAVWPDSANDPISYTADVLYDDKLSVPVSGSIVSSGRTTNFSFRKR